MSIQINPSLKAVYNIKHNLQLHCTVYFNIRFIPTNFAVNFQWKVKNSSTGFINLLSEVLSQSSNYLTNASYSSTYNLDSLSISDAGNYSCSVYLNSMDTDTSQQKPAATVYAQLHIKS